MQKFIYVGFADFVVTINIHHLLNRINSQFRLKNLVKKFVVNKTVRIYTLQYFSIHLRKCVNHNIPLYIAEYADFCAILCQLINLYSKKFFGISLVSIDRYQQYIPNNHISRKRLKYVLFVIVNFLFFKDFLSYEYTRPLYDAILWYRFGINWYQ